jgi:hypothetical protein
MKYHKTNAHTKKKKKKKLLGTGNLHYSQTHLVLV